MSAAGRLLVQALEPNLDQTAKVPLLLVALNRAFNSYFLNGYASSAGGNMKSFLQLATGSSSIVAIIFAVSLPEMYG